MRNNITPGNTISTRCKSVVYYAPTMILLLSILSACNLINGDSDSSDVQEHATQAEVELPESEWGTVELLGQAEHRTAPVFIDTGLNTIFTWTGSQDNLARHFSRGIQGDSHILDLIAFFPQEQALFPINRGALMLWLDRTNESSDLRLQATTISFDGTRMDGVSPVTTRRTRNYTAIALNQRQLRVVSSGGQGEVTNLYLHHVDDLARPVGDELLVIDADYPALIRDNDDTVHLFWLSNNGRDAYHARFDEIGDPVPVDIQQIARHNVSVTDAAIDFSAGFDGSHVYLLWTIRHIDDTQEVWMSSGLLGDEQFSTPARLMNNRDDTIQWIAPAGETQNPLPVVANSGENLLLLWLQNGTVGEREFMTRGGRLTGVPHIVITEEHITVSWSQPTENGYANLFSLSYSRDD